LTGRKGVRYRLTKKEKVSDMHCRQRKCQIWTDKKEKVSDMYCGRENFRYGLTKEKNCQICTAAEKMSDMDCAEKDVD
jgi:hypothetical protein